MNQKIPAALAASLLAAALLAGCSGGSSSAVADSAVGQNSTVQASSGEMATSEAASAAGDTSSSGELVLTVEELAQYNGKDGQPAYVAVDGVIYDVTDVPEWANGEHKNGLTAGHDLTEEIKNESPHGLAALDGLPIVGRLA